MAKTAISKFGIRRGELPKLPKTRQGVCIVYYFDMADSIDTLVNQAMHLPPDQRLTLAHRIMCSIEPVTSPEVETAWDTEITERIERYDSGTVKSIPASEVFSELAQRLHG